MWLVQMAETYQTDNDGHNFACRDLSVETEKSKLLKLRCMLDVQFFFHSVPFAGSINH